MIYWGSPSNQLLIILEPHPLLELLLKVNHNYSYLITFPLYSYLFSSHYLLSVADRFLSPLSPPAIVDEAKGSEELADGIGQEVHQGVKERLQSDPDYNSEQFPSAEKVFQPNQ